jgi:hypothetical protein
MSDEKFTEHLEQASETVRRWPSWKRSVLGPDPEPDMETVNASMKAIDEGDTQPIEEIIDSCLEWNPEEGMLEIKTPTDNMTLQVGLEEPPKLEGD